MIRTINALQQLSPLFPQGRFHMAAWENYMAALYPDAVPLLQEDVQSYLQSGHYTFEKDFLPVISAVPGHADLWVLQQNFAKVMDGLNEKIQTRLQCALDVDVVLYLGLNNAAGWVTTLQSHRVILLGAEKILELGWHHQDALYGLVYHELGHIFHDQYGAMHPVCPDTLRFIWQLFSEGIAMHVEQLLVGQDDYFHQDTSGWKSWCSARLPQIARDFQQDLPGMTRENQRYFGDWADYEGHGDVGYYLGAVFIRFCLKKHSLKQLIQLDAPAVHALWLQFLSALPA